jgi:hypothetical protein
MKIFTNMSSIDERMNYMSRSIHLKSCIFAQNWIIILHIETKHKYIKISFFFLIKKYKIKINLKFKPYTILLPGDIPKVVTCIVCDRLLL